MRRTLICSLLLATAAAASTPSSGTLTPTSGALSYGAGPFFISNVTAQATTTPTCTALTPCDDYTLTVALPSDWQTTHPTDQVVVKIQWPNTTADFDVYILDAAGNELTSSASSSDPEIATFAAGQGTYTVTIRVAPFTVAGDSFTGTVSLVTPAPAGPPSVTVDPGPAPRFQTYAAPEGHGTASGEPSIGGDWKTGNVMFLAGLETLKVRFDDSTSPARATWSDVSSQFTSVLSLDPILFTDHDTGRTFVSQLVSGLGYGVGCSLTAYSDDDGESWIPSEGCGTPAGADHQTIGGGPSTLPAANPVYAHTVYYCSQAEATAFCARSDDGGLTFGPGVPLYTLTQCGGLHGHVKVAPDGTAYVPNRNCGGQNAVVVSEDGGLSWSIRPVPTSTAGAGDPSVGIGANGSVYLGYMSSDGHAHVAVSHDKGVTWASDADVGSLFGIQNTVFPAVVAGDDDRAAMTFLGTTTPGDFQASSFGGVWHLYSIHTYDGGKSWSGADATPTDPVQRGCVWLQGGSNQCRNLLDFTGAEIDSTGRVVIGFADGCTGACVNGPPNTFSALASIARQSGGRPLFAKYDPPAQSVPSAPLLSGQRDSTGVHLSWPEPDNGGSAITAYRVYRGPAGGETLLAQVTSAKYDDTTVSGTTPFYRVSAVNAVGEGPLSNEVQPASAPPPVVSDPCHTPGVPVASDPAGDQTGAPASSFADITALSVAEPYYTDGSTKLVFTMKVAGSLNPLPPNVSWKVYFITPDNTARYISMDTFQVTPRYQFGHTQPGTGGVSQNVNDGAIDPASGYTADGTITLIVDEAKIGAPAQGQTIGGIHGTTQLLVGATAGLLETVDDTTAGSYTLVGRAACSPNNPPVAALSATPTSGPEPLAVSFDASGSSDPDAGDSIASYALNFGDGTSATQSGAIFTHTYNASGTFTASLTVTDSHGKASAPVTVTITSTVPASASSMSGSGFLSGGPKFSLNVSSPPQGSLTYSDDVGGVHFTSSSIDSYSASGKCATFTGRARDSQTGAPLSFTATACDNGNPGRNSDSFSLSTGSTYAQSGVLQGGNLKQQ